MEIKGLQKTTLLDYPGKIACTVFTGGCNFRCPFCQNAGLVLLPACEPSLDIDGFFTFLKKRRGVLDGVCISGGEPLLHTDISAFIQEIKQLGFMVKLDTNGSFPDRLSALVDNGLLDYIAMDIKAPLCDYPKAIGMRGFDTAPIVESASYIMGCGVEYEFRTTAARGLIDTKGFISIGEWLKGAKRYFIQAFRDSDTLVYKLRTPDDGLCPPPVAALTEFSSEELHAFVDCVRPYFAETGLRGVE